MEIYQKEAQHNGRISLVTDDGKLNLEIFPGSGDWVLFAHHQDRTISRFDTQEEAEAFAENLMIRAGYEGDPIEDSQAEEAKKREWLAGLALSLDAANENLTRCIEAGLLEAKRPTFVGLNLELVHASRVVGEIIEAVLQSEDSTDA